MMINSIKELYYEVHNTICKLLNINVEPIKDIIIVDSNIDSWYNKNKIYLSKKLLNELEKKNNNYKIIKLVGILAHEDTHYILRKLNINLGKTLEEAIATIIEYIIMFEWVRKLKYDLKSIKQEIEGRLKHNLEYIEDEKKGIPRIGYIIGLTLVSKLDKENLIKVIRNIIT